MLRNSTTVVVGTLSVLASLLSGCGGARPGVEEQRRIDANLTADGVRQIVEESPDEFLAAVQEVVDNSDCQGIGDGSSCLLRVRVAEYIGGESDRPLERQAGWSYLTIEMRTEEPLPRREIGRSRLVVAVPLPERPGVYGSRVFLVDPSDEDVAELRRFLDLALSRS